jgi:OOP family OmpA-OmpF porin
MKTSRSSKWRFGKALVFASVLCAGLAYTSGAFADGYLTSGGGIDMRLFKPAVDSKGFFTVNASSILPHLNPSFGLVIDYGYGMFRLNKDDSNVLDPLKGTTLSDGTHIVQHGGWGVLHVNLGLFNWVVVGLQLPVGILSGDEIEGSTDVYPGVDGTHGVSFQGLGNLSLHVKARFLRVEMAPVGLAAVVQYFAPSVYAEKDTSMGGDTVSALSALFILDKMFGRRTKLAFNIGAHLPFGCGGGKCKIENLPRGDGRSDFKYSHSLVWGLGLSVAPVVGTLEIVFEYYGNMIFSGFSENDKLLHIPMELAAGFKVYVERNSYLYLGVGTGAFAVKSAGYDASLFRIFAAFIFEPSIGDRDGDGIKDDVDACPDDPEDRDDFEDKDGCPDPDNDRDGILDYEDDCPLVPEDKDGDEDDDGCPEGQEADRDGDGILDNVDACPDDPEDLDGFEDEEGCPDPDNDQDGILDVDDLCPNDPEDFDDFEDKNGCPDLDNDNDRILDVDDSCPIDPETYNGFEDEDGCPDQGKVEIKGSEIVIMEKVYFETDSAEIKPESYGILDAVAATIVGNPQIVHVQVQGHADERASNDYNISLTQERAASVVKYLTDKGVDDSRLSSAGYGEECPVDKGHNAKAWEKNRRVEFKILETTDGCTNVTIACDKAIALGLIPAEDEKYMPGAGFCD